ncbi:MAG TPA: bifunctional enoyl-CoA hydratase/phosphate acetyltransferase [Stellaceae bacterium]|nr:bifunctional enoyl-CoA hydratase/phosphate acetyltransferase [Stellaceae bacterium]
MAIDEIIENHTFDEIRIGDTASATRTLTRDDVALFAAISGDVNPTHAGSLGVLTAHSMWGAALVSAVLGTKLPGPGTVYAGQSLHFHRQIVAGDTLTTTVTVRRKLTSPGVVVLDCECHDETGAKVLSGRAEVKAPTQKFSGRLADIPEVRLRRHEKYATLIARCQGLPPVATAVAYPCDGSSLLAVADAAKAGIIRPWLVGPISAIRAAAAGANVDLDGFEIVEAPNSRAASEKAVELVRTGKAELLMKGSLHTDELMGAVVRKETGLRTSRRISHCFIMDVPSYAKPLVVTDAAINIAPDLADKVDILQNAIDLAHALGLDQPRVAILSAVETVNPKIQSTLDAAALCKMAERGQITGGIVDGPLALDNAISAAAARIKGIVSSVAGQADILLVPGIEAGNMLAKNLSFLADADGAGIVLGARVPVILTSRADSVRARMASCAVAALYAHAQRKSVPMAAE